MLESSGYSIGRSESTLSLSSNMTRARGAKWYELIVGEKEFKLMTASMCREKNSLLAMMTDAVDDEEIRDASGERIFLDEDGRWNIDASAECFPTIKRYLQNGILAGTLKDITEEELKIEAEFYRLDKLRELCEQRIQERIHGAVSEMGYYQQQRPPQFVSPPPPGIQAPISVLHQQQPIAPPPGFQPLGLRENKTELIGCAFVRGAQHAERKDVFSEENSPDMEGKSVNRQKTKGEEDEFCQQTELVSQPTSMPKIDWEGQEELAEEEEEAPHLSLSVGGEGQQTENQNPAFSVAYGVSSTISEPPINSFKIVDTSENDLSQMKVIGFKLVNGFVENFEQATRSRDCVIPKFYESLSKEKSSADNWLDFYGVNMGDVLSAMQQLKLRYPDGCSIAQYAAFENEQKMNKPLENGFTFNNTFPTVVSLLHNGLVQVNAYGRLHVSDQISKTPLFCLRRNLCSNLFRELKKTRRQSDHDFAVQVHELLIKLPNFVPEGVPGPECLISVCNRYPMIFKLDCSPQDNYRFDTAWVSLNPDMVVNDKQNWRVVLDCDVSAITNSAGLCDCGECHI